MRSHTQCSCSLVGGYVSTISCIANPKYVRRALAAATAPRLDVFKVRPGMLATVSGDDGNMRRVAYDVQLGGGVIKYVL